MKLAGLLQEAQQENGLHVVEATTALLRIANATPAATSADFRSAPVEMGLLQKELLALPFLAAASSEYLSLHQIGVMIGLLERSRLRPGLASLVAAQVLDVATGRFFLDHFRTTLPRLRAGDPVLTMEFPSRELTIEEREELLRKLDPRTNNPATLTPMDDRTPRLRLAPVEVERFHISMRWVGGHLESIRAGHRFAMACTNQDVAGEFEWQPHENESRHYFYGVAPRDVARQQARLEEVINDAVEKRASVLVLPELCLTEALANQLIASPALQKIPLVALGSYHTAKGPPGHNLCRVLARGVEIAVHHKFSDFWFKDKQEVERHEYLVVEESLSGFEVLLGTSATAVTLICKDVADRRIATLVQQLAPNLVMVPAMSPRMALFERFALLLAGDPQAFTMVCAISNERSAIFGRPVEPSIISSGCEEIRAFTFEICGTEVKGNQFVAV